MFQSTSDQSCNNIDHSKEHVDMMMRHKDVKNLIMKKLCIHIGALRLT